MDTEQLSNTARLDLGDLGATNLIWRRCWIGHSMVHPRQKMDFILLFIVISETGHINMKKQTLFFYYKKQQSLFSILENDFKYMRVYLATLIS
jgi:hypothetical protein